MSRISEIARVAQDIKTQSVTIPEWGDLEVNVVGMDGHGRARYYTNLFKAQEDEDVDQLARVEAELIIACTFDPEDGTPAFLASDVDMLLGKAGSVISLLATTALEVSGMDKKTSDDLGKDSSD